MRDVNLKEEFIIQGNKISIMKKLITSNPGKNVEITANETITNKAIMRPLKICQPVA
tara:strand:- start:321 stop:491 length:171 start_codon:yes stop_codon:yes gene_type:complete